MDPDDVEAFLERECELLDSGDFAGWVDLCTDDAVYWMPVSSDQTDPLGEISILYENRTLMELRKFNFGHPLAPSFEVPVRCSHLLGRVDVLERRPDEVKAKVKFHCLMWYRREQRMFAGHSTYQLVPNGKSFRLRFKRVDLLDADDWHKSIPISL